METTSETWSDRRGERVADLRKLLVLTQAELAERSGIPQSNLSLIERGKRELTEGAAFRICQATGTPMQFFNFESPRYGTEEINFRKSSKVSAKGRDFVEQSFKEVERVSNTLASGPTRLKNVPLPVAEELDIVTPDDIEALASDAREAAGLSGSEPVRNVVRTLERAGMAVATVAVPPEDEALLDGHCGLSRWDERSPRATIAFITGQPGDRQRFTVAHELGHALLHSRRAVPLKERETEANLFAGAFLLPQSVAADSISETLTLHGYMRLKAKYGISIQALISRGKQLGLISPQRQKSLMIQLSSRGWRKNEPIDVGIERPMRLWTELAAMYGATPYFAASKELGVAPAFLEQWIPERDAPRVETATNGSGKSNVVSLSDRASRSR